MRKGLFLTVLLLAVFSLSLPNAATAQDTDANRPPMGFFVTSVGMGNGADLGGLDGADRHCQALAESVGSGDRTWRAYLSKTEVYQVSPEVNARDRIGPGPWYNANGVLIALNVADLHGDFQRDRNNIRKYTALDERGEVVPGWGDQPSRHEIMTGSDSHGRALIGIRPEITTCNNWTSSGEGSAMIGHHDRMDGPNVSWNAAHFSRGCSQDLFERSGGAGLFYCFAADAPGEPRE